MAGRDTTESQVIGSRIREARIKNGMSQAELAVKSNISLPHISDIELGKSNMMLTSFIRITEALQVSADSLLRPNVPGVTSLYRLTGEIDQVNRVAYFSLRTLKRIERRKLNDGQGV